jgi:hypothetical protein
LTTLESISPAADNSTTASATCATTSVVRARAARCAVVVRPDAFNESLT